MVHMNTENKIINNDPNNVRLRELISQSGLTQSEALDAFNQKMIKPYKESSWKAFLSNPSSKRWRRFDAVLLAHAEKVFSKISTKK